MKRIVLFLATNVAVLLVLAWCCGCSVSIAGHVRRRASQLGPLLAFSAVVGFTGSIISLLMSKSMAKWTTGAHVIEQPANEHEAWLVETVRRLATKAGIGMPEVAIYEGTPMPSPPAPSAIRRWSRYRPACCSR